MPLTISQRFDNLESAIVALQKKLGETVDDDDVRDIITEIEENINDLALKVDAIKKETQILLDIALRIAEEQNRTDLLEQYGNKN